MPAYYNMRRMLVYYFILSAIFNWGCNLAQSEHQHQPQKIVVDTSITRHTSFNNLFLDTTTINEFLSAHPEYQKFQQQYSDFYKQRNYECAWFDTSGISEQIGRASCRERV